MEKLIFSYKNWELLYGTSPFTLEPDKVKMREKCDGDEVDYDEEKDLFNLSSPWGEMQLHGRLCLKKEGEADHTIEEIKNSPALLKESARLIKNDYLEIPFSFQMLAYIMEEDGRRGFAMVTKSKEFDQTICRFSLRSPVSFVSEEVKEKMESGLLDKYFSCYPVGALESGEMADAWVYPASVDRLSLCMKELTGKENIGKIDYAKLEKFLSRFEEVSPENKEEYKWYYSLTEAIMKTLDPGFTVQFS